jgi:CRP-like cAMP-binding protein
MSVYLAAGLSDADMIWLLSLGRLRRVGAGQRLIVAGRPIDELFFVLSGTFDVVREDGARVAMIGEGEVAGEMSFVGEEMPSCSVVATGSCEVLGVARSAIVEHLDRAPDVGMRFYRALAVFLADRLRETTDAVGICAPGDDTEQSAAAVAGRFRRLLASLRGADS